ncbi:MAG: TonB-dependent receptor [Pseudomonadota bacterium]
MKPVLLSTAAAAVLAAPVFAQESAEDSPILLDEIIVSLPGPDRPADELIGNVTAIDRDEIVETLATTLGDTLDGQPGVASTYFGPGSSRPVLRGFGSNRVLVLTNGIGVIDASAASPDHQVAADGIDAQRIEILRGPAALAYGGQAIGGVVNVIDGFIVEELPEAPSFEAFGAYTTVDEGVQGAGRGQLAAGPFVFTLSGSGRDANDIDIPGFVESPQLLALEAAEGGEEEEEEEVFGTLPNSFVETWNVGGGVSWVGDGAFFGVAARHTQAEYGLPGGHGHEEGEEEEGEEEEEESPFIDLEQTRIDARGGIDINAGVLRSINGSISYADYEHIEFEAPGEAGTVFTNDGVEGRVEAVNAPIFGFEGALGVQFRVVDFSAVGEEAFVTPTDISSVGVFLYESREWDSGFGVEGGVRYDNTSYDNVDFGGVDFNTFSASIGAHRHLDGGLFVGADFSYTERAPSEVELFSDGPHLATGQFEVGDPGLDVETAFDIEGTIRLDTGPLRVGVNIFYAEFADFIFLNPGATIEDGELVTEADGLPVFLYEQENADFIGGEIFGEVHIGEYAGVDWIIDGSIDFVEAEFDNGVDVPLLPPLTLNAGITGGFGPITAGVDVTHATTQNEPGPGFLPTNSYTLVNVRGAFDLSTLGLGGDGTEVFIEARNLSDEDARVATSTLRDVAPLPGRNVRVGARVAF